MGRRVQEERAENLSIGAASEMSAPDGVGRLIGLGTFLIGISLLLVVFYWAYGSLGSLDQVLKDAINRGSGWNELSYPIAEMLFAFLMSWISSLIAGHGINLYGASLRRK
ncbi:MAG: hypothetical protein RMK62_04945 [Armatimonadota bacterium]|nr:hypothetical protein [Armatimonadota bacterium]